MKFKVSAFEFRQLFILAIALVVIVIVLGGGSVITAKESQRAESDFEVYLPVVKKGFSLGGSTTADVDTILNLPGNEPTTAVVNPRNPANIAIANFAQLLISTDFGQNFLPAVQTPIPAALAGLGYGRNADDVLAFDSQGRLFWVYLLVRDVNGDGNLQTGMGDDLSVVVSQINPANGTVISAVDVTPGNFVDDKPWIAADANPVSPFADNLYVIWTRNPTFTGGQVLFSRSVNQGANWSAAAVVSAAGEGFPWPSHVAVAPNGDLYASYHANGYGGAAAGRVIVLRDSTGGVSLAGGTPVQKREAFDAGECALNGNIQGTTDPNPDPNIPQTIFWMQGAFAPYVLPDPIRPGNIYVVCNDDPDDTFGSGDEGDIVFARSTDNGNSWDVSTISHAPTSTLQVFPMGAIDQDGNIAVHWYDNRRGGANAAGNLVLDRYATVSKDGGLTFSNDFQINEAAFDPDLDAPCRFDCGSPNPTLRIGEYHGITAVDGFAYTTWTGNGPDTDGDGLSNQAIMFDQFSILGAFPDHLEPNESIDSAVVASLGADDTYNVPGLTIHSATDVDFFKIVALNTGKLEVEVQFSELINQLDVQAFDRFGNAVASGTFDTIRTGSSQAMLTIPVIERGTYFVQVFDPNAGTRFAPQSTYNLTIVNRPVPIPFGLDLAATSDSGMSSMDNVTNISTPMVRMVVSESALEGLSFSATPDANLGDDDPGYKIQVFRNGNSAGFATPVGGQPGVYQFSFSAGAPLAEGANFLTARVLIVDPSDDPNMAGVAHALRAGPEASTLMVMLDTVAPASPSVPDLLSASDSGASDTDNVTRVNPPAFQGTGEANAKVRILADGAVIGQELIGSDLTDGIAGNGLGAWEVTVEPLADGTYAITAEAEDLAGNISVESAAMVPELVIDTAANGTPQRPTLDLLDEYDTGRSFLDNVTRLDELVFRVSAESGTMVMIKDGNAMIDTFVMPASDFTTRTLTLSEGPHPLSSESTDLAGNSSHQSHELLVTVDLSPPAVSAPDLATSSDTAGVNDDDVTTIRSPAFVGQEEINALVRIFADGIKVGDGVVGSDLSDGVFGNGLGAYEVTVEPLDDAVYDITAQLEDQAGNVSLLSTALPVTIAKEVLHLSGATAGVVFTLADHRITGFPGYPSSGSVVGVLGIPVVNLDLNSQSLEILGTSMDDEITYTPTGPQSGNVMRQGLTQSLNFSGTGPSFSVDPGSGIDTVAVNGTVAVDAIVASVDTASTTVQVNGLQTMGVPIANVERLAMYSFDGDDTINVTIFDTVSAALFVDAGDPASTNPVSDVLNVFAGSPQGKLQKQPGGPVPGSGSVFVSYPLTTGYESRIDHAYVESVKLFK